MQKLITGLLFSSPGSSYFWSVVTQSLFWREQKVLDAHIGVEHRGAVLKFNLCYVLVWKIKKSNLNEHNQLQPQKQEIMSFTQIFAKNGVSSTYCQQFIRIYFVARCEIFAKTHGFSLWDRILTEKGTCSTWLNWSY